MPIVLQLYNANFRLNGTFPRCNKAGISKLYEEIATGGEVQRSIDSNSKPDYREKLNEELRQLRESEMWQTGAAVHKLLLENN